MSAGAVDAAAVLARLPAAAEPVAYVAPHRAVRAHLAPPEALRDVLPGVDLDALVAVIALTDPGARRALEWYHLLPAVDRPFGPGAGWALLAFTAPAHPSRFTDGSRGVWYAGLAPETARAETRHHLRRQLARFGEPPQRVPYQLLRAAIAGLGADLAALPAAPRAAVHHPDDYAVSQAVGAALHARGTDVLRYDSVRHPGGTCLAALRPRVVLRAEVAGRFAHHWDGERVTTDPGD